MGRLSEEELAYVLRKSPAAHFEGCVRILDKENRLVRPVCNVLQRRMSQVYEVCMEKGVACRMIVMKPRQVGCSTFSAEILYHHCRNYVTRAVQIADDMGNSDNIFRIFCRHVEQDEFPWRSRFRATKSGGMFSHGSVVEKDTAHNPKAGISATRQGLHASEVAKWAVGGVRAAHEVMGAMLNSLADVGRSVAVVESTPHGAAGWFYEVWRSAVSLEDFLGGIPGNGWVKVFVGWHEFEEHVCEVGDGERKRILESLDEREKRGMDVYGWSVEQIAWRRKTKESKCGGSERVFDEYYPEDDVSCFLVSGSPCFELGGVLFFEELSRRYEPERGLLCEVGDGVVFEREDGDGAWVEVWERPVEGRRYVVAVDLSVGEDQSSSDEGDPDRHSVLVLREGYLGKDDVERGHMLVARVKAPTRVGFDVLAWEADLLSRWYGRCVVVPEMNHAGMAFIERLKERDVPIYRRQRVDAMTGRVREYEGWQTTEASRKLIVDELVALVRDWEDGVLDVRCGHVVGELRTFVRKGNGREEALSGCHDDDVLALAIGLHCLPSGTVFRRGKVDVGEAKDSYEWEGRKKGGFKGVW